MSVPVPLMVIVPTLVPLVKDLLKLTASALAVIASNLLLSLADIKPAAELVAAETVEEAVETQQD